MDRTRLNHPTLRTHLAQRFMDWATYAETFNFTYELARANDVFTELRHWVVEQPEWEERQKLRVLLDDVETSLTTIVGNLKWHDTGGFSAQQALITDINSLLSLVRRTLGRE